MMPQGALRSPSPVITGKADGNEMATLAAGNVNDPETIQALTSPYLG